MTAPTADPKRLAEARKHLARQGVDILLEDHLLLGISKGSGVLSQPGPEGETSLVELLDEYRRAAEGKPGRAFVGLVHRLDRNVSGAMVVAKSTKAASRLSMAIRSRTGVEKTYLTWVAGAPPPGEVILEGTLSRDHDAKVTRLSQKDDEGGDDSDARAARLAFEVAGRSEGFARLLVRLETGVTHQIRAQLAAVGLPIVGDSKYGGPPCPRSARCERLALHSLRLVVRHPVGGAAVTIEAPVPGDLRRLDAALRIAPPLA